MSNAVEKAKNATRRFRDEVAVKKQIKIAKQHGFKINDDVIKQPHRLVKHHAMDCGVTNCPLCGNQRRNKSAKTKEKLTKQEQSFYQDLDNQTDKHSNGIVPKDLE